MYNGKSDNKSQQENNSVIQESEETFEQKQKKEKSNSKEKSDYLHTGKHKYDTAVHSNLYDQIRSIPTGGYSQPSIVDRIDPKNQIANMNPKQLALKLKQNFKSLYQNSQDKSSQFQQLPRLINDQKKQNSKNAINISDGLNLSPKYRGQSSNKNKKDNTLNISNYKFTRQEKEDPIMKQYNNARKQIQENIEKVATAVANQQKNAQLYQQSESQQQFLPLGVHSQQFYQMLKSNEDVANKAGIISNQGLGSPNLYNIDNHNLGFSTQINLKEGIQRGALFSSLEDQKLPYDNSTMAGTHANTNLNHLLKTEYRLNQNSQHGLINNDSRLDSYLSQINQANFNFQNRNTGQLPSLGVNSAEQIQFRTGEKQIYSGMKSEGINYNFPKFNNKKRNQTFSKTQIDINSPETSNKYIMSNNGKAVNYQWQNVNQIKEYQTTLIDQHKERIQQIHSKLMHKKNISSGGNSNIIQIEKLLSPYQREIFLNQSRNYQEQINDQNQSASSHFLLFKDMNNLNGCFMDIIDSVCSYKIDLGVTLQLLVESYNSVFLQQYEVFYKGKIEKEKELDQKILNFQEKQKDNLKEKEKLISMQNLAMQAIETKNNEIQRLLEQNQQLENQIEVLREMLRTDQVEQEKINKEKEQKEEELEQKEFMTKDYGKKRKALIQNPTSSKLLLDPKNIPDLKETLLLAASRIEDRNQIAEGLFEIIKQLLQNKHVNQKTQTDQACMNNAIIYDYYSNDETESLNEKEETKSNKEINQNDEKLMQLAQKKGIVLSDDENHENFIKNNNLKDFGEELKLDNIGAVSVVKDVLQSVPSNKSIFKNNPKLSNENTQIITSNRNQVQEPKNKEFNILDDPQEHHNKAMRQIGLRNPKRLKYLHDLFDKQCILIKQKKNAELGNDIPKFEKKEDILIPYKIISFIQNRILQLEKDPKIIEKFELMPWLQVKDIIFDIYDHRIRNAPEINGSCNTNYCTLNEHLLIFFVDKKRSRQKAEEKIVDILINIRYYQDTWPRAKMFLQNMQMSNFPQESAIEKIKKEQKLLQNQSQDEDEFGDPKGFDKPHSYLKDIEISENDIFTQEFFLHSYSLLSMDRSNFHESEEGFTYVRTKHHEIVAKKIIPMIKGPCGDLQKWTLNVRKNCPQKKLPNKDKVDTDYLDMDLLLGMIIDQYKFQRREFQKEIQKTFMRLMESNIAQIDVESYNDIIKNALPPSDDAQQQENPLVSYPGNISKIRAYIFSCIASDENSDLMTDEQFLAGCWRFAIENPVPTISTRCALYGNSRDIMFILKEAEKEYGKPQIKIDSKAFTSFTMGLAEKKDFKKRQVNQSKNYQDDKSDNSDIELKRRQLIEGQETPYPSLDRFKIKAGLINLKMEFLQQNQKDQDDPATKELQFFKNQGVKLKITSLKQMIEEQKYQQTKIKKKKDFDGQKFDEKEDQIVFSNQKQQIQFTKEQFGLSNKQIVVPSFETTGKVFNDHFLILRELRYKIELLKQAYYGQMDKKRTWEQVDEIIKVLSVGQTYLDFPVGTDISEYVKNEVVPESKKVVKEDSFMISKNQMFGSSMLNQKQSTLLTPISNEIKGQSLVDEGEKEIIIENEKQNIKEYEIIEENEQEQMNQIDLKLNDQISENQKDENSSLDDDQDK